MYHKSKHPPQSETISTVCKMYINGVFLVFSVYLYCNHSKTKIGSKHCKTEEKTIRPKGNYLMSMYHTITHNAFSECYSASNLGICGQDKWIVNTKYIDAGYWKWNMHTEPHPHSLYSSQQYSHKYVNHMFNVNSLCVCCIIQVSYSIQHWVYWKWSQKANINMQRKHNQSLPWTRFQMFHKIPHQIL